MQPIAITILAVIGLGIAIFIYRKKSDQDKVICMVGEKCDEVLSSKYGRVFGFRNEILGLLYYVLFIAVGLVGIYSISLIDPFRILLLTVSSLALAFSLYLVFAMGFILKKWCDYCVVSAVVNFLIIAAYLF